MGTYISRQRDFKSNQLYVELAVGGPNKAGPDKLTVRYEALGEGKNLVDPRDAITVAERLYKQWELDYHDEKKKLRIVNLKDKTTNLPVWLEFEFNTKGLADARKWANNTYDSMQKCAHCNKAMGNKTPYQLDDLPNQVFDSEYCLSKKYRDIFGVEAPKAVSNKEKKLVKK